MTTLTNIPKHIQIKELPYMGPNKRRAPKHRKYACHIQQDGVMPKMASYTTLEAACLKAAQLSEQYGTAVVLDQSRATGQRMVKLFKRGIDYLAGN